MTKIESEWREFIGISCTEITSGDVESIDAVVPELIPLEKGDPKLGKLHSCSAVDPTSDKPLKAEVTQTKMIRCSYLGSGNTNQMIPCVHVGERVRVFNYAGTQQFYWMALGRDPGLRHHEHVRWFAMNQPKAVEGKTYSDVTDKNSYFVDINTNKGKKEIHVHTEVNDGEPYGYDIHILPEAGQLKIIDTIGHELSLDSGEHRWYIHNVDNSNVELNKENITIECKDTIKMVAGKHMIIDVGETQKTTVGKTIDTSAGTSITEKSSSVAIEGSSSVSIKGASVNVNGSGTVGISGGTTNISGGGGDAKISGISLVKHKHPVPPHCPGAGMSSPPVP